VLLQVNRPDEMKYAAHLSQQTAMLATTGPEGWAAKLEMANDPLFAHFKDRAIALAQEKAAEEADSLVLTDGRVCGIGQKR
jgi:hypothetical protein